MASLDHVQLSSVGDAVHDLAERVARLGEELDGTRSDAANALFEAERSLRMAERAVERARRALGG